MWQRTTMRLAALLLGGCAMQLLPATVRAQGAFGSGTFRPPGYGAPGGGGVSRLGTYGELGDRTYAGAAAGAPAAPGRELTPYTPRITVPIGGYGVTIPVPGGVGTPDMYRAGPSSANAGSTPGEPSVAPGAGAAR